MYVQVAVRAVPYRKDFIEALKKDPSITEERVIEDTKSSIAKLKTHACMAFEVFMARTLQTTVLEISGSLSVKIVRMRKYLKIYAGNVVNNTWASVQI